MLVNSNASLTKDSSTTATEGKKVNSLSKANKRTREIIEVLLYNCTYRVLLSYYLAREATQEESTYALDILD
jgi:hypothetical protein